VAHTRSALALALFATSAVGCAFGPSQLERGHIAYNAAVNSAADEELLLNIVRVRYLDTLDFLATTSISSQLSFGLVGSAGGGGEFGGFGGGEFSYSTRPTFTFSPQRGQEFAQRLIEPVQVDVLTYLAAADWDVRLLMRLFVRGLNDLENELGVPDPRFIDVTDRLAELQMQNRIFLGFVDAMEPVSAPIGAASVTGTDLVEAAKAGLEFRRESTDGALVLTATRAQPVLAIQSGDADGQAVLDLLGLSPGREYYELNHGTQLHSSPSGERNSVTVRTGSLLRAVMYLSQGVQVPDGHVEKGTTSREWPPGVPQEQVLDDLFTVRSSKKKPKARLAVSHRGHWFYIDDADQVSRYTFFHMAEAFRLGLTPVASQDSPVLTLPVGGP
jgi:hypothetical protein